MMDGFLIHFMLSAEADSSTTSSTRDLFLLLHYRNSESSGTRKSLSL